MRTKLLIASIGVALSGMLPTAASVSAVAPQPAGGDPACDLGHVRDHGPGASAAFSPPDGSVDGVNVDLDPIDLGLASHETAAADVPATTIPVWFHVITNGPGTDVTDLQLQQQLQILDSSFEAGQGGAATPFSFSLAGIDRTDNAAWYGFAVGSDAEIAAKSALRKGDAKTLNIYVNKTSTGASWATFPWRYRWAQSYDGVVLSTGHLVGGTSATNSEGDVAVHEAGHWLGLYHTFQGYDFATKTGGGCAGQGDYVADTPAEDIPSSGCPLLRDTCVAPGADPIHNFMNYSADACANQFTVGQVDRMKAQWTTYRAPTSTKPGKGNGRNK